MELSPSQAKQIAGRAGRYGSNYPNGEALTYEISKCLISLPTTKQKRRLALFVLARTTCVIVALIAVFGETRKKRGGERKKNSSVLACFARCAKIAMSAPIKIVPEPSKREDPGNEVVPPNACFAYYIGPSEMVKILILKG